MSKRDDILAATLDLISEEGLQSITFSKIFKRANVGSGTVYNYFKNKEELVGELYVRTIDLFSDVILRNYDHSESVFVCFKRLLTNMAYFSREYQKEQWFLENYSHSPFISEEIRNREISAMTECIFLIQRGTEQGLIRKIHPMMCVQMINGMLTAAIQGVLLGKYPMDDKEFEQVIEICWRAFVI
jgi:TetR/AcrR family transcriptional regulator, repressor of fatR-cypB operon